MELVSLVSAAPIARWPITDAAQEKNSKFNKITIIKLSRNCMTNTKVNIQMATNKQQARYCSGTNCFLNVSISLQY
jgi:hypothetical protein